ncbi:uncharacterized protein PgNI_02236 [Pyricularia grisea]|uniref:Uncharacterized protein n=1 Tax=Pyricularia grisea TaxID=148305 RepID=A0A6P8BL46_PYRGI|nr:uncharacterized protein PgNI_02236 [Pyricularia grisea]TLD17327.1 hypothetical protein PgNI_02236 [Pyricularia grisea]
MAVMAVSSAAPIEESHSPSLLTPVKVDQDGTEDSNSVAMAGCIVRAWDGNRCDGRNLYAYEYTVCRTGRGLFAGGGYVSQCFNVNTGHAWNTGTVCFGPR